MDYINYLPPRESITKVQQDFPQLDVDAVRTGAQFLSIANDIFQAVDRHFAAYGISYGRFILLMILYRHKERGLSPYELAELAGVTRGTITGLLDKLEGAGYIRRDKHPKDRRMLIIGLSDTGIAFLESIFPDHLQRSSTVMANLDKNEREEFIKCLKKIQSGISALWE